MGQAKKAIQDEEGKEAQALEISIKAGTLNRCENCDNVFDTAADDCICE